MKRLLCMLTVLVMLLTLVACGNTNDNSGAGDNADTSINSANEEKNGDHSNEVTVVDVENTSATAASKFDYREVDGGVAITDYTGEDKIVVIPDEIDGMQVVAIDENAFVNNDTLLGLKLCDNVKDIGSHAFTNCTALRVFISGDSLLNISEFAFGNCQELSEVRLNEGLKSIQFLSFAGSNLRELYIPGTVETIDNPFTAFDEEQPLKIISTPGSAAEDFVAMDGEYANIIFEAKEG